MSSCRVLARDEMSKNRVGEVGVVLSSVPASPSKAGENKTSCPPGSESRALSIRLLRDEDCSQIIFAASFTHSTNGLDSSS